MPRSRWIIAFFSIVVLLICTSGRPYQQRTPDGGLKFDNGYTVEGDFLKVYQSADDPALIFGQPISGVLKHPLRPEVEVQYFQRARMELDSSAPAGKKVSLAPLGSWLYGGIQRGKDANIDTTSAACRHFESTRHAVCFAFLQFYNAHNGAVFFGDPISEVETEGERLVQYFDRARMEWWPDRPSGLRLVLTDIGTLDYREKFGDPLPPDPRNISPETPGSLVLRVFPAKPLLGQDEKQTIFVIVQDQQYNPVEGAQVTLSIQQPDGSISPYPTLTTNAFGIAKQANIPLGAGKPNEMVLVKVSVSLKGVDTVETTTWYRIWW